MNELWSTMKGCFDSIDGLSSNMVLAPEDVINDSGIYDLLVVDEAHRLYQRHHLPGLQMYAKFDVLMKDLWEITSRRRNQI